MKILQGTLVCLRSSFNLEDTARYSKFAFKNELVILPPLEVALIHHKVLSISTFYWKGFAYIYYTKSTLF